MTIPTQQRPLLLPCLDINLDRLLAVRRQDIRHLVWNFPESTLGLTDLLRCMLLDVQFWCSEQVSTFRPLRSGFRNFDPMFAVDRWQLNLSENP